MEKQRIKCIAFTLLLMGASIPNFAQHPGGEQQEMRRRTEIPSPENNARNIMREFKKVFTLTDKQYDKVYDLYLKQEKSLIPSPGNGNRGGMPPRGGMGRPGGAPGMGGTPPQGGFRPDDNREMPTDLKAQMESMRKEQEKKQAQAAQKLKKKMKKIMKGELFEQWEQWETNRNTQKAERPKERR